MHILNAANRPASITFYSIIFGILLVAACREFLQALFGREWRTSQPPSTRTLPLASTVTLLVINDVLFTSYDIEQRGRDYSIQMKLIDLILFLLLAMSIVLLDPKENQLGVKVDLGYFKDRREAFMWFLLSLYWALGLVWDRFGKRYPSSLPKIPVLMLLPLLGMFFLTYKWRSARFTEWARWTLPFVLLLYIIIFKLYKYAGG